MNTNDDTTGVLLLWWGAPRTDGDIDQFVASIMGGPTPPLLLKNVRERYQAIGGYSPAPQLVDELAGALQYRLNLTTRRFAVRVGALHSRPSISDSLRSLMDLAIDNLRVIVLVPQYSAATVGLYRSQLNAEIAKIDPAHPASIVRSWATHPLLIQAFSEHVCATLETLPFEQRQDAPVVFTAHSVPLKALPDGDTFEREVETTAAAIAAHSAIRRWQIAFQSAPRHRGACVEPLVENVVESLATAGHRTLVLVPIQFLFDNMEILYDLDIALTHYAQHLGVTIMRTESLNTSSLLVEALADLSQASPG